MSRKEYEAGASREGLRVIGFLWGVPGDPPKKRYMRPICFVADEWKDRQNTVPFWRLVCKMPPPKAGGLIVGGVSQPVGPNSVERISSPKVTSSRLPSKWKTTPTT